MMKIVLKLHIHDDKDKRKIMKSVSKIVGIDSLEVDTKENKLTVIGDIDPCHVVCRLRKHCPNILTVGPAKEEKKDGDGNKKKVSGATEPKTECSCGRYCTPNCPCHWHYYAYDPYPVCYRICEENPSVCVIS